jgi:hypothetical protein
METTNLERTNLEAHVDLCAERYKQLDLRLTTLEVKVDAISTAIANSSNSMRTVLITSTATVVTGLLGLIATLLLKF